LEEIRDALVLALPDTGWLTWPAPVISQPSAITISNTVIAEYRVAGGVLDARLNLAFGSAGTAANNIVLSGLPVQPQLNTAGQVLGFGFFYFGSTSYGFFLTPNGSGGALLVWPASGGMLGTNPGVTIATNDSIYASLRYRVEAA
jgi:hypothetical protein